MSETSPEPRNGQKEYLEVQTRFDKFAKKVPENSYMRNEEIRRVTEWIRDTYCRTPVPPTYHLTCTCTCACTHHGAEWLCFNTSAERHRRVQIQIIPRFMLSALSLTAWCAGMIDQINFLCLATCLCLPVHLCPCSGRRSYSGSRCAVAPLSPAPT